MPERLWAAWYAYMQNDVLATGIMSFAMHEIVYFARSLPWLIIDRVSYFNKYKIQHVSGQPFQNFFLFAPLLTCRRTKSRPPRNSGTAPNSSCSVTSPSNCPRSGESFFLLLLLLWRHLYVVRLFHPMAQYCGLATGVPFPSVLTMAYQIAIFFALEDTWHYFSHRALHWGPLYKTVHKIHHKYSAPFGMAAEYASPIEVMILGFGSVGPPILWCAVTGDLHILTMYIWIVLRLFQAIDAHSGYEFPWSLHHFLPFWAGADHHDVHHEKFVGNFASSFRWWDYLLGTEYSKNALQRRREKKQAKAAKKAQ